ncbi:putative NAD(P)H quinone oxidoreductase, PIG3 family [Corynebacterium pollutisoli]|uniref:Putative NAD(P)H quinone oxidoreductase, PIG3 family n=1 Tax=Corynebacterium pollutisoli TaxID=1610489 RepID=A0A1X7IM13_9CORY|nr:NAD(P)H-quinone oxidoreductase [Corynebacterium pollutisoli]SMG16005.1 putative NAD(P)H quinone oxidoreductase, PIG3 family [Corynebacterium pollutisoli]
MKAIELTDQDDPRSLALVETDTPQLQDGEVLVKVHAAGVNRGDLLQARGHYPPPPGASEIIGLECAGIIEDPGTTGREKGEEVACLLAGGGYGEYVAVPEGQLMPIPEGYSLTEAAAVVEVACTVWSNLGMLAGLREGQTVLIHGGAGGIGTFAIQLCKQLGATVAVTAGSAEKLETCRELGADILINYKEQDFSEELTGRCDIILDIMGAKYLKQNLRSLAEDGQLIIIGLQGGVKTEINLGALLPRRLTVRGTTLRARSLEGKAEVVRSTVENVWPLLADGRVRHHIHATFPLSEAAAAHELLDSGEVTGKLVLEA